jgi:hypothetical protein
MGPVAGQTRFPLPNLSSIVWLSLLAAMFLRGPGDLDYGWQIRTGEHILASGRIGHPDTFSYTIAGKELPDHEWLYEVLLALVWKGFGDGGLNFARVCLYIIPVLILERQLRRRGVPDYSAAWFVLLAGFMLFWFERLRPLVCTTICLQLVSGWLYDQCRGRRPLDWKLPLTMLLWGNLHPAVIMGQFLLAGAIIWEWVCYMCGWGHADERFPRHPKATIGKLTIWGLVGLSASMICPAPINRFTYPFAAELRHPIQRRFVEIMPTWQFLWHEHGLRTFIAWLVVVLAVIFTFLMLRKYWQFRVWEWALYVCLLGLAFTAARAIGDWLLIALALIVPRFGPWMRQDAWVRRHNSGFRLLVRLDQLAKVLGRQPLHRPQRHWSVVGLSVLFFVALAVPARYLPNRDYADAPKGVVDWLDSLYRPSDGPLKIFSGSNEGAYLIWRLDGGAKVYTDTRGFFYPGPLLEDSFYLPREEAELNDRLERVLAYGTDLFLLPVDDADGDEFRFWQSLKPYCSAPLYSDDPNQRGPHFVLLTADQVTEAVKKRSADPSAKRR